MRCLDLDRTNVFDRASDAELVIACQQKESRAFEMLVKRHQQTVYSLLRHLAPDWSDTTDLSQEVFLRVWRFIDKLRNPYAFRTWLAHIATNVFYDELRKRQRELPTVSTDTALDPDEEGSMDIVDNTTLPDEAVACDELAGCIEKALSDLPEQFRMAIVLREVHGLSYDEIAAATDCGIGTVKSRIARARAKVQRKLTPYLGWQWLTRAA